MYFYFFGFRSEWKKVSTCSSPRFKSSHPDWFPGTQWNASGVAAELPVVVGIVNPLEMSNGNCLGWQALHPGHVFIHGGDWHPYLLAWDPL